jgi:hypothetical protein
MKLIFYLSSFIINMSHHQICLHNSSGGAGCPGHLVFWKKIGFNTIGGTVATLQYVRPNIFSDHLVAHADYGITVHFIENKIFVGSLAAPSRAGTEQGLKFLEPLKFNFFCS